MTEKMTDEELVDEKGMTEDERIADLSDRVNKFHSLSLPGQSPMMHMGTAYLVGDLCQEIKRLRNRLRAMSWRPISEAPKDGTWHLYHCADGHIWIGNEPDGFKRGIWHMIDGKWRGMSMTANSPEILFMRLDALPQPPEPTND